MSNNVATAGGFERVLKGLLVLALLPFRRLHFDPHIAPINDANNVRAPERPEPVKVLVRVPESAGVVAVMKNASEGEVVEYLALYFRFIHLLVSWSS